VKSWYLIHKWTSLVCTAFMLLLCLTGLPLIFSHEIDHMLGRSVDPPELAEAHGQASLDDIVTDAAQRRPGDAVQFVIGDPDEPNFWFVRMGETIDARKASAFYFYDARTGDYLHAYPLGEGFMDLMLRLHIDLFAGLPGMLFLGFTGLLLLAALVSGAVLYGPFMRRLPFGTVRHSRGPWVRWLDLHNLIGVVTLTWVFVVGLTGVINTLTVPIFAHWQNTQLAEMIGPHRDASPIEGLASAQRALDAAQAAEPDMRLSFMAFPGNGFAGPRHFVAFMQGNTAWTSNVLKPVLVDADSGQAIDSRDLPWYVHALLLSQPLHFGDYGGMPMKILWAVLDLLTIILLGSGLYLWLKKRDVPAFVEAGIGRTETDSREFAPAIARQADPT
jgi:uncharacterized iron-regulated membrane protein